MDKNTESEGDSHASRQAILESANKWAEIGQEAARKAQAAAEGVAFGRAEVCRINAKQAFDFELQLRNLCLSHDFKSAQR